MKARSWLMLGVVVLLLTSARSHLRPPTPVIGWLVPEVSGDSLARSLDAIIGGAPALLAGCGPRHVLVSYFNAPIDLRPEIVRRPEGRPTLVIGAAERSRREIAAAIAGVTWAALGRHASVDTVTVRLERRFRLSWGRATDYVEFSFVWHPTIVGERLLDRGAITDAPGGFCPAISRGTQD